MKPVTILHLEDDPNFTELLEAMLTKDGLPSELLVATDGSEYLAAMARGGFDVILSDSGVPGFSGRSAFEMAREQYPQVPFIFVSGNLSEREAARCLREGATDCIPKDGLERLTPSIKRALADDRTDDRDRYLEGGVLNYTSAMQMLVAAVQELSLARNLDAITATVRRYARELTGADGATFVLREGDYCYYADENAISPLWRGRRFPIGVCIGGWAMRKQQQVIIEDVYNDSRIPIEAYRPTFIKSLVMVPIRTKSPIGAIGNYWAKPHKPTPEEVQLIQALADSTSVAMENVQVYTELEQRVRDRTAELEYANRELEAFSYTVSHDLRSPLTIIKGFSRILQMKTADQIDAQSKKYFGRMDAAIDRMNNQIDEMLALHNLAQVELNSQQVDLSRIAQEIIANLQAAEPARQLVVEIEEKLIVSGDPILLHVVLENLLSNAWKYSSKRSQACIQFGSFTQPDGSRTFYVRDNGAGFNMTHADKLFTPFQRMHSQADFPGTGVGLASVQRIIHKHGGRIWAESAVNEGATFYFTLAEK